MLLVEMERSISPLHVHVGKKTPVHVHLSSSGKSKKVRMTVIIWANTIIDLALEFVFARCRVLRYA